MTHAVTYPVVRYQFEVKAETKLTLPFYSGSMLRGAFGHAMRRMSCVTKMKDCDACLLKQGCPYTIVFETKVRTASHIKNYTQLPALCIFEPLTTGPRVIQPGETFNFSMVLIGETLNQLPLIILAWQQALATGLGAEKSSLSLVAVRNENDTNSTIWTNGTPAVATHDQSLTTHIECTDSITLNITTPMRLQRKSQVVKPADINPMDLMASLVRRLNMIEQICRLPITHSDLRSVVEQSRTLTSKPELIWTEWQRYSQRQRKKMVFGGVTGQWTISGDLAPYSLALVMGQWLHIGKNTTFGMGRYSIQ